MHDFFGRQIGLLRDLGDTQRLVSLLAARVLDTASETLESTNSPLRRRDECAQDVAEALRLARQMHLPAEEAFIEVAAAFACASFGDFGAAFAHAQEALRIATSIGHREWITAANGALGEIYLLLLHAEKATMFLEFALAEAQALGSTIWQGNLTPYLALAYTQLGQFSRAAALLATIMPRDQSAHTYFERQAAYAWGKLALAQGDADAALRIADELLASAPGTMPSQPIPHLLALKGEALLVLKHPEDAVTAFAEAKHGAEQRQAPSLQWRIHRALRQALHQMQRDEQAQNAWTSAQTIIAELATTIEDVAVRDQFQQAALARVPYTQSRVPRTAHKQGYGGLSGREREVATLVAQGKSNREIADALVVSERTAEAHVSNILGKLGFASRAQIAAWVVANGLTALP